MGRFWTISILTVLHHLLDVLIHLAPQGYCQCLDATADTQHRNLAIESQTNQHQLGRITLLIDVMKTRRRFFAHPQRVMISPTRQNQTIEMLQGIDDDCTIGNGRNNDRRTTCRYYLLIITITKRCINVFVIGCDAYYGLMLRFGKRRVRTLEMRLQVKCFHLFILFQKYYSSSKRTGISRLILCSSEMSVSVETTPGIACNLLLSKSMSCSLSRAYNLMSIV